MRYIVLVLGTLIAPMLTGCGWIALGSPQPLGAGATLEIFAVSATNVAGARAANYPATGGTLYLIQPAIIVASDVETVQLGGSTPQTPELLVNLTPTGAQKMLAATTPTQGQQLAIVVNGKVMAAPKVRAPISNSLSLAGMLTEKDSDEVFESLTRE